MSERSWYVTLAGSMRPYEWERYRRLTRGLYQAKEGGMKCYCGKMELVGVRGVRLPGGDLHGDDACDRSGLLLCVDGDRLRPMTYTEVIAAIDAYERARSGTSLEKCQDTDLKAAQGRIAELERALRGLLAAIDHCAGFVEGGWLGTVVDDAVDAAKTALEDRGT